MAAQVRTITARSSGSPLVLGWFGVETGGAGSIGARALGHLSETGWMAPDHVTVGDVSRGRVLIIEADEWVTTLLSKFLADAGYELEVATTARSGFDRAVAAAPDLILADVILPDIDGFWVTRRIRAEKTKLASTPILLVSQQDDHNVRTEALALGADVFLAAPFRHEEVIAQLDALMGLAQRMRAKRDSIHTDPGSGVSTAFQGDLAQITIPTMLTMLEMERRTGKMMVRSPGKPDVTIELLEGGIVSTRLGKLEREPISVMREVVTWTRGKYTFEPSRAKEDARVRRPIGMLLLEAMRLNDESSHRGLS